MRKRKTQFDELLRNFNSLKLCGKDRAQVTSEQFEMLYKHKYRTLEKDNRLPDNFDFDGITIERL